jgi:hypothetical protein
VRKGFCAASAIALAVAAAPPIRSETETFYVFSSDYLQALHLCYEAEQMDVNGRRPLVDLVFALDGQRQRLNEAHGILGRYSEDLVPNARRAVEVLLRGVELSSLNAEDDLGDINAMNTRGELVQRIDSRLGERRRALEVMAASAELFRQTLVDLGPVVAAGRPKASPAHPRLTREEAVSLWKQATLLFGEDMAREDFRASPILAAVEDVRKTLREVSGGIPSAAVKHTP